MIHRSPCLLCCDSQYGRDTIASRAWSPQWLIKVLKGVWERVSWRLGSAACECGLRLTFATSSFVSGLRLVSCVDMVGVVIGFFYHESICARDELQSE
jgi:hypothetical protein